MATRDVKAENLSAKERFAKSLCNPYRSNEKISRTWNGGLEFSCKRASSFNSMKCTTMSRYDISNSVTVTIRRKNVASGALLEQATLEGGMIDSIFASLDTALDGKDHTGNFTDTNIALMRAFLGVLSEDIRTNQDSYRILARRDARSDTNGAVPVSIFDVDSLLNFPEHIRDIVVIDEKGKETILRREGPDSGFIATTAVLKKGATVGSCAVVLGNTMLGEWCHVRSGSIIYDNVIIGPGVEIRQGERIGRNTAVWNGHTIREV